MKTVKLANGARSLVTWGRSAAMGNVWLKLHNFSRPKNTERLRQGFELAYLPVGQSPL